jgi:hypothetical protein
MEPIGNHSVAVRWGVFHRGVDMSEGESKAAEYRRSATALRSIAEEMHFPESRAQLMVLARAFDALAERVENWQYPAVAPDAGN